MVFVTGYSGRFPASESVKDFWNQLCAGKDLVSKTERYPGNYSGLPGRQAEIMDISKFDSMFFGISSNQAANLDPQIKMLLESVFEAVTDAGHSMEDLSGSNTGVYVGGCYSDLHKAIVKDIRNITGYENTGCSTSMISNRVSFCFNFRGPSMTIDTACSSSLVAFDFAVRDILSGKIDRAIVGGVSVVLDPRITKSFQNYNMLSPNGKCHSFDSRADGYVRADAIGAVLLESPVLASFGYVRILGTGVNSDGWKSTGITFPSADQQIALCRSVCAEYNIDASKVRYVEAHGTGTVVGDRQELRAIDTVYGKSARTNATTSTLIGSIKSNMGHSEGASGIMSLIKLLGVFSEQMIPRNLHFETTPHEYIKSGSLQVVTETTAFSTEDSTEHSIERKEVLAAVNNFGFGGTNAHVVVQQGFRSSDVTTLPKTFDHYAIENNQSRWIFGRNELVLQQYVDNSELSAYCWRKLWRSCNSIDKFPYRAVVELANDQNNNKSSVKIAQMPAKEVKLAFCYSGQGSQWVGMGKDLWEHNATFRATVIDACEDITLSIPIEELFVSGDKWNEKAWSGLGITLIQIGLTKMLTEQGLRPDYIFGHSVGEVACGYADGCTSAKEAARIAYLRCHLSDKIKAEGLMMAIGLGIDDATAIIQKFPDTVVACYNSPDGVTLSGPTSDILAIEASLKENGVFARIVNTDGVAYHSSFFKANSDKIEEHIAAAILDPPLPRTPRWLSTSVMTGDAETEALFASPGAKYHTNNIAGMVNFAPVVAALPAGTVVVEVGPHSILKSILKRCNDSIVPVSFMLKEKDSIDCFKSGLDALWLAGVQFHFSPFRCIVPPSRRIPVRWDHDVSWRVADYQDYISSNDTVVTYDLAGDDAFMMDHFIDGRSLFPAMGHIYTIWQVIGVDKPIQLKNIKILKAVILDGASVSFTVKPEGNMYYIYYSGDLCASCESVRITTVDELYLPCKNDVPYSFDGDDHTIDEGSVVAGKDMYSSLARYGYEYKNNFQLVQKYKLPPCSDRNQDLHYKFAPTKHWVAFLDNVLQANVCLDVVTGLRLPTQVDEIIISDPNVENSINTCVIAKRNLNLVGNANVTIRGLHTTLTRKFYKPAVMNYVKFVPYGEHVYKYQESYKNYMLQLLTAKFWSIYDSNKDQYGFLKHIAKIAPTKITLESVQTPAGSCDVGLLESVTNFVYADVPKALENAYFQISTAPGHDDLYALDASSSCIGAVQVHALDVMVQIVRGNTLEGGKVSVLELGAGSGGLTRNLFPAVQCDLSTYTATDISNIKQLFPSIQCVRYDLNESWTGDKVNLVAASNAVHTGKSLSKVLSNINDALLDGGFLLLHEYICVLPVLLWGLNDFAWSSDDGADRDYALWTTKDKWMLLLHNAGFEPITWYVDECAHQMLLLARKRTTATDAGEQVVYSRSDLTMHVKASTTQDVDDDVTTQSSSLELATTSSTTRSSNDAVYTSTKILRTTDFADLGLIRCLRKEPGLESTKIQLVLSETELKVDGGEDVLRMIDTLAPPALPIVTYSTSLKRWGGMHEYPLSLSPENATELSSAVVVVDRGCHVEVAQPGNLESLQWVQNKNQSNCKVSYCGLNFKDAMLAFGRLTSPGAVSLGLEFSGFRVENNQIMLTKPIMGISSGCMADTLRANEYTIWDLPPKFSSNLAAAATIPVVYATVYYSLVVKASIRRGQTVLIHSIAGGVGQAALHVCRFRGVNVIVTCSASKAAWVHEHLRIEQKLILDSHSTRFRDDVMELTGGEGVDVVLNSLSGEKLQVSLSCLAPYGQFCEIGKYDIQQNSAVGLGILERNISLHVIDLSDMFDKPKVWQPVHDLVSEGMRSGEIVALNTTVYDNVEEGLRCISAGKHIGKVLVNMDRVMEIKKAFVATRVVRSSSSRATTVNTITRSVKTFRTSGAHLVIGGLGGFGLELVSFLWAHGAEAIVIVSRGKPKAWQRQKLGAAHVVHVNLIDEAACMQFMKDGLHPFLRSSSGAPVSLVGVWHLGMVLNDRLSNNMSEEAWKETVDVKKTICDNLDVATRVCHRESLQHFVVWSSVSALFGNAGQTNYAYGNAGMESTCMRRRSDGLCGTAIQWGLIGGVGVMVDKSTNETFAFAPQHIDSCFEALDSVLLHTSHPVVTSYVRTDVSLIVSDSAEMTLVQRVARILGIDSNKVREGDTLAALGMDSLQSVEVLNVLKKKNINMTQPELQVMTWGALSNI